MGGATYGAMGGRPRVPRATTLAAEAATVYADELISALRAALAPDQSPDHRSRGAARWLTLAAREHDLQHREAIEQPDDCLDNLGRSELLDLLVPLLAQMTEEGTLPQPPAVVDAEAVEVEIVTE